MKKIVEGNFALNYTIVSLKSIFTKLKGIVQLSAKIKHLQIRIESIADTFISTDEQRLMQVLLNLTSNGIKYTREGSVEVVAEEEGGDMLKVSINDTGTGIKPENLQNLFKMFGLVDMKSTKCDTGIGIGLYLSKYIINEMGGKLTLTSFVGKGTQFCLKIPMNMNPIAENSLAYRSKSMSYEESKHFPKENASSFASEKSKGERQLTVNRVTMFPSFAERNTFNGLSPSLSRRGCTSELKLPLIARLLPDTIRKRSEEVKLIINDTLRQVLVVEDDAWVLLAIKNMIEKLGYQVEVADNGEIAVNMVKAKNLLKETKYDVIFMDVNMPVMNGYLASRHINDMMGLGEIFEAPIICLSAQDSPEHRQMCKEAGIIEQGSELCNVHSRKAHFDCET